MAPARIAGFLAFVLGLGCRPEGPATKGSTVLDNAAPTSAVLIPTIDGSFWQIAGVPDLGAINSPRQQPVDFAIWPAADGAWQLWSCIRDTKMEGEHRVLHRWEGATLTDAHWTPKGIAMEADPTYGETLGGLQAPFVLKEAGVFHMFYGDWENICHQTSTDGKTFTRVLTNGKSAVFSEGAGANTRDPMVLKIGDTFYLYYSAYPGGKGADFVRTSKDLVTWSASKMVAFGGAAGTGKYSAECPFVVYQPDQKAYYLFRTQLYGARAQTRVYRSPDPTQFGIDDDRYLVETLPIAAPEIAEVAGRWYIATVMSNFGGIQVANLAWTPKP
ncbi:MAG: hypothetical protein ACLQVI_04825 [Polyangiaceae bacterium]